MLGVIAQAGIAWNIGSLAIAAVVIAAIVGIVYVMLQRAGLAIPPFVVTIFWIVICALPGDSGDQAGSLDAVEPT